jgi:hypothetical protein
MIKRIYTLLILLLTLSIYGQNATLIKNYNPKAKELKHNLSYVGDTLILASEKQIIQVDIFNEDYEKLVVIEDYNAQISLRDLPEGKFVVEAKLVDKIILMDIIKYDDFNETDNSSISDIAEGQGMMLDEGMNIIKNAPNTSIEYILTREKKTNTTNKSQKFYWIVIKVNNESGSTKTMKLVDQKSVDRMIIKNKLENSSAFGKFNELIVWEVYNTSKFMEQQVLNPDFMYSLSSDLFNTTPYYSTQKSLQNL